MFYKELPTDDNSIFVANLAEQNEIVSIKFKKSREYAITGLSINQDTGSTKVAITDTDRLETLSNLIQRLVKKTEPNLDLVISNEEILETVTPFRKKKLKVKFLS